MTEKKYIDIEGMREKADAEFQAKVDKSWEGHYKQLEHDKKQRQELQELWGRSIQSERDRAEQERDALIEAEKVKAAKEIEAKYESQGVKSEDTKQREEAYRNLLKNLPGMNE